MYHGTREYFEGRTLGELRNRLFAAPQPGKIGEAAQAYWQAADQFDAVVDEISAALRRAVEGHQGPAAEAAQAFIKLVAAHGTASAAEADQARTVLHQQGDQYAAARNKMPTAGGDTPPELWELAWRTPASVIAPSTGYPVVMAEYTQARQQAVDLMNGYQDGSNSTIRTFQQFDATPPALGGGGHGGVATVPSLGGGGVGSLPSRGGGGGVAGVDPSNAVAVPPPAGVPGAPDSAIGRPAAELAGGTSPGHPGASGIVPGVAGRGGTAGVSGRQSLPTGRSTGTGSPSGGLPRAGGSAGAGAGGAGHGPLAERAPQNTAGTGGMTGRAPAPSRPPGAAIPGQSAIPFAPMGAGVGRQDEERRRPSWLVQDDPEEFWLGDLPPHVPPVIGAPPPRTGSED